MPTPPNTRPPTLRLLERRRHPRPAVAPGPGTAPPLARISWWERLFFGVKPTGSR